MNGNVSNPIYDRILAMWNLQDTLLQSYRNIFLIIQSILFSAGLFIAFENYDKPSSFFDVVFIILIVIGVIIVFMWYEICVSRAHDVSYFQSKLLDIEKGENVDNNIFTKFKEWQENNDEFKKEYLSENELLFHKGQANKKQSFMERIQKAGVREKMGLWLPCFFGILWMLLFVSFLLKFNILKLSN